MKRNRTISLVTLALLILLAAGCRKEQEDIPGMRQEEKARYSVGLHLGQKTDKEEAIRLQSREEKLSYALGLVIGHDLGRQEIELESELLARGFQDGYSGTPALTDEEMEQVREEFSSWQRAEMEKRAR